MHVCLHLSLITNKKRCTSRLLSVKKYSTVCCFLVTRNIVYFAVGKCHGNIRKLRHPNESLLYFKGFHLLENPV